MYKTLTLRSIDVSGDVFDMFGSFQVTSVYHNEHPENLETTYKFCLDPNAVVDSLKVIIGDRELIGKVQEKSQARTTYTDAVKSGKKTSLLEKNDDIYSLFVGNILSGETIVIKYSYLTKLTENNGKYVFAYPTNIGSRYGMSGVISNDSTVHTKFGGANVTLNADATIATNKFFFRVSFWSNGSIESLTSLTNDVVIDKISENNMIATLSSNSITGDLNILVKTESTSCVYYGNDSNEKTYCMITQKISDETVTQEPKEIYFFLDRSGSMSGSSINDAVLALTSAIQSVNQYSFFNVISFGTKFSKMFSSSVCASNSNKTKAIAMLKTYKADMSGTEIFECFKYCLNNDCNKVDTIPFDLHNNETKKLDNNMEKIFFFLTDGQVDNQYLISDLLKKQLNVRIFSVGIGSSVSRSLIEEMSNQTNGVSRLAIDSKTINDVMTELMEYIYKKYYVNTSVIVNGNLINTVTGNKCIYPNTTTNFLFILDNVELIEISLSGFYLNEQKQWPLTLESKINIDVSVLQKLVLNELIKEGKLSNEQIIEYSIKYNIMNNLTSFVLVDDCNTQIIEDNPTNYETANSFSSANYFCTGRLVCEEVDALDGGMDMFGGGGGGHYVQKYNTNINWHLLSKLLNVDNYSYKFESDSWKLLCYLSQDDFDKHATQMGMTRVLFYNMIILTEFFKTGKNINNAQKLLLYFNSKYPGLYDSKGEESNKLYTKYIENLKTHKTYVCADY